MFITQNWTSGIATTHPQGLFSRGAADIDEPVKEDSCRALICGVLARAIRDFLGADLDRIPPEEAKTKAARWLYSNALHPFSFIWCCDCLGLNGEAIRERLPNLTAEEFFYNSSVGGMPSRVLADNRRKNNINFGSQKGNIRVVIEAFNCLNKDGNKVTMLVGHRVRRMRRLEDGRWEFEGKETGEVRQQYEIYQTIGSKHPKIRSQGCKEAQRALKTLSNES